MLHFVPDQDDRHEDPVEECVCPTQRVGERPRPALVAACALQVDLQLDSGYDRMNKLLGQNNPVHLASGRGREGGQRGSQSCL